MNECSPAVAGTNAAVAAASAAAAAAAAPSLSSAVVASAEDIAGKNSGLCESPMGEPSKLQSTKEDGSSSSDDSNSKKEPSGIKKSNNCGDEESREADGVKTNADVESSKANGGEDDDDEEEEEGEEPEAETEAEKEEEEEAAGPDEAEEDDQIQIVKVTTPVHGKKSLVGKAYRTNGRCLKYRCESYGIDYEVGDTVYIESQRTEQPYYICIIQELKMTKRDSLMVHIKWFYRTSEVPEQVYQLLIQDRRTEHGQIEAHPPTRSKVDIAAMNDPMYRTRELFISEMTDVYPVSVLRGKCQVLHCLDIRAVKEFQPKEDTFFYTLSYNPETRRLASTQGEIRVGGSHQAKLPPYEGDVPVEKRPSPWGEEISWCPDRIHDHDLLMFLRAARSMAAFAAMCDGGSPEDGFQAASRDGITATAIQKLHECDYDTGKALQGLVALPLPSHDILRKWPEEDVKNFIKGLRAHGKNFFKIRVDFLPERDTSDLIEFYYLWKKTSAAANNRPRGRRHRPNVFRRIKGGKSGSGPSGSGGGSSGNGSGDGGGGGDSKDGGNDGDDDLSSCSEVEEEPEGAEGQENGDAEMSPYYCRHCFASSSRDWHHAGKQKLLVCTDCRIYFKRYAELPSLDGEVRKREVTEEEKRLLEKEEGAATEDGEPPRKRHAAEEELSISAIEQDSKAEDKAAAPLVPVAPSLSEPVEIKADLPRNVPGLFSPVPTLPSSSSTQESSSRTTTAVGPLVVSQAATEVYGSSRNPSTVSSVGPPAQPAEVEVLAERRSQPTGLTPLPVVPREPSPPPKPDGSECHRSQSAIFTRLWNRGEGNSCSRTDMIFKPVPDSKLARKREERMRKAAEREEMAKQEAAKRTHQELTGHPPPPGHPLFSPDFRGTTTSLHPHMPRLSPFPPGHPLNASPGAGAPSSPNSSANRPLFPPGFAPAPPPPGASSAVAAAAAASMQQQIEERRRLEELSARVSAERQYAERMSALATDPLVRLQMAGVTPEIPGASHFRHPFGLLGAPPGFRSGPPAGLDPRYRPPDPLLLRPPPVPGPPPGPPGSYLPASSDLLQRQLLLEREHSLMAAHQNAAVAQQSLLAQQEEFFRLEQEARARQASSRP